MTELLYHVDSYLKDFEATVVATNGQRVALDRTAFYATSGGQPHGASTLRRGDWVWQVIGCF